MKVSVSVLKDYDRLIPAVKKVNNSSADFLHVDVMDGQFVDNKKFPLEVVRDVKQISSKPLDVHLMVESQELIKEYVKLSPAYLTFHVEVIKDYSIIDYVKSFDIKVGLAINPETNIECLMPYVDDIDLVLFMSVTPGAGGQEFKEEVIDKIKAFKKVCPSDLIISIDGGVNGRTVSLCKYAGCDMVVAGSYITDSNNYEDKISNLR